MFVTNTYIQHNSSLKCQRCGFSISMDISTLLSCEPIICPICGIKISIEHDASEEGLTALYHLKNNLDR